MTTIMSKEKVLAALKGAEKPLKAGEIVDLTGLDRKEVDKAMKALKDEGAIVSPKVCFWEAK
jgi:DNA-binding transcriptional regulator GbsR (MarR family)